MDRPIQVLLIGPYQLYLDCLEAAFKATGRFGAVARANSPDTALERLSETPPDLILIDVEFRAGIGVEWIDQGAIADSYTRFLILGTLKDEMEILDWIEAGAEGVHLKENPLGELLAGIEQMMKGEVFCPAQLVPSLFSRLAANSQGAVSVESNGCTSLTQREREIHAMLIDCLSNKQIASRLHLSLHTVKNHVHNILEKLGVADRLEAIKRAYRKT